MASGKIKWFERNAGYGFIIPDEGGADVFLPGNEVKRIGYVSLFHGVKVAYDHILRSNGRAAAGNLRIVEDANNPGASL